MMSKILSDCRIADISPSENCFLLELGLCSNKDESSTDALSGSTTRTLRRFCNGEKDSMDLLFDWGGRDDDEDVDVDAIAPVTAVDTPAAAAAFVAEVSLA